MTSDDLWPRQHDAIHATVDDLPDVFTRISRRVADHDIALGASIARCRRLLMGIDGAHHAGNEEDLAGVFVRPYFETWLTGFYVLFEGAEGWERLKSAARRHAERLARTAQLDLPDALTWIGEERGPTVEEMARRVSRHFEELGEPAAGFPIDSYNLMYRHASQRHAHGGAAPLLGHISAGPPATIRAVRNEGHTSATLVLWGGMLLAILADRALEHLELPVMRARLDTLTAPLQEARDPGTWRYLNDALS